jgi:cytoskeletal protein RodZ
MPPDYQTLPPRRVSASRIVVLAVLIIGLAVLVWLVFFHHMPATNSPSTKSPSVSQSAPPKQKTSHSPSTASSTPPPSSEHSSSPGTTSKNSSSSSNSKPESAQPNPSAQQALTNTGPGNTLALFIGASLLGIGTGNLYLRRRLARSNVK